MTTLSAVHRRLVVRLSGAIAHRATVRWRTAPCILPRNRHALLDNLKSGNAVDEVGVETIGQIDINVGTSAYMDFEQAVGESIAQPA